MGTSEKAPVSFEDQQTAARLAWAGRFEALPAQTVEWIGDVMTRSTIAPNVSGQ